MMLIRLRRRMSMMRCMRRRWGRWRRSVGVWMCLMSG